VEKEIKSRSTIRREQMHHDILETAARLIAEKGSQTVSLEEIAKEADIARKTLYNHFNNKEAIIDELILPVCNHARDYLMKVDQSNHASLEDIWTYCLELWKEDDFKIKLLYKVSIEDYAHINESKHGFIILFMKLLKRISTFQNMTDVELKTFSDIIYATYMPLLQSLGNKKGYEKTFRTGMTGLIEGIWNQSPEQN